MIRILGKIPKEVTIACSGGPDSMAALDFLIRGKRHVTVAHFDHGTSHGKDARDFIEKFCNDRDISIRVGQISRRRENYESPEEYWRNERYRFLKTFSGKVITAHHLDDSVEWYLFSALHGKRRVIPYERGNVIRPFLTTQKEVFVSWCKRKDVPYMIDPSNSDERFMRSIIRNKILPEALRVNPGIRKVVRNMVESEFNLRDNTREWERPVC